MTATQIKWTRVTAGHYDSTDGQWRIDTCSDKRSRWELRALTDRPGSTGSSWGSVGRYPSLKMAKEDATEGRRASARRSVQFEGDGYQRGRGVCLVVTSKGIEIDGTYDHGFGSMPGLVLDWNSIDAARESVA